MCYLSVSLQSNPIFDPGQVNSQRGLTERAVYNSQWRRQAGSCLFAT